MKDLFKIILGLLVTVLLVALALPFIVVIVVAGVFMLILVLLNWSRLTPYENYDETKK